MPGELSREFLLKIGDGEASETFTTVGSLTAKNLELCGDAVDVTDDSSISTANAGKLIREAIAGGVATLNTSGDFRVKTDIYKGTLVPLKMSASPIANWQVVVPGIGTFETPLHLDTLSFGGQDSGGDVTGSMALSSTGDFTFTAEA